MKRLLVTGASGYLGQAVMAAAPASGWEAHGTYLAHPTPPSLGPAWAVDLTQPHELARLLDAVLPCSVIHTACSNRDGANLRAIVPAAANLARACRERGLRLVHVSTDLVFDGERAPYTDESPMSPCTPYGQAKAEAEAVVAAECPAAASVRPSLIWALDPLDRQTGWLVDGARIGTDVTLFTDEVRCPVHLPDLAAALLELAERPDLGGAFNAGGAQPLNRWEFGLRLLAALDIPRGPTVMPGLVANSGLVRARNLTMLSQRAGRELCTELRGVDAVLAAAPVHSRQPRYCEG